VFVHSYYIKYNGSFYFGGVIVKKPSLRSFSNEILILLSKQKNDKLFDEEVRQILVDRYTNTSKSYFDVYLKYCNTCGVEKLAYGDLLATHLIEGGYSIEEKVLVELLPYLSIENVWALSKSNDTLVREKSHNYLLGVLDLYEKAVVVEEKPIQKTNSSGNIIYFKRKGE